MQSVQAAGASYFLSSCPSQMTWLWLSAPELLLVSVRKASEHMAKVLVWIVPDEERYLPETLLEVTHLGYKQREVEPLEDR